MKNYWIGSIAFLILLVVGITNVYAKYGLFLKYDDKKISIEKYLEEKYKDDFLLGKIDFDWKNQGSYHTQAKSMSTNVSFFVSERNNGEFEDSYVAEYWADEAVSLLDPTVSRLFDQYTITVDMAFQEKIRARNELNSNLDSGKWIIHLSFPYEFTGKNKHAELEKLFLLAKDLNDLYNLERLHIDYYDKSITLGKEEMLRTSSPEQLEQYITSDDE